MAGKSATDEMFAFRVPMEKHRGGQRECSVSLCAKEGGVVLHEEVAQECLGVVQDRGE